MRFFIQAMTIRSCTTWEKWAILLTAILILLLVSAPARAQSVGCEQLQTTLSQEGASKLKEAGLTVESNNLLQGRQVVRTRGQLLNVQKPLFAFSFAVIKDWFKGQSYNARVKEVKDGLAVLEVNALKGSTVTVYEIIATTQVVGNELEWTVGPPVTVACAIAAAPK